MITDYVDFTDFFEPRRNTKEIISQGKENNGFLTAGEAKIAEVKNKVLWGCWFWV